MKIPNLVTSYLQDNKLKQYELAELINEQVGFAFVTPMAVSYWENGIYRPSIKTMTVIQRNSQGKLREFADAVINELETGQPVQG
jgi:transcriptional regulator with XRE-family HTH domain